MARKKATVKKEVVPYWTIFNSWLTDNSLLSPYPEELDDKCPIRQSHILQYFKLSPYGIIINKMFNNYSIFQIDKKEIFLLLKRCVVSTGYKQPWNRFKNKDNNTILYKKLKQKYPDLKYFEIEQLIKYIDSSDEQDSYYDTFGIAEYKPQKITKENDNKVNEDDCEDIITGDEVFTINMFMEKFNIISDKIVDDETMEEIV